MIRYGDCWGVMEGIGEEVESMEETFFVSDSGLGEVVVAESDCVGEEKGLGGRVDDMEATVVIEGGPDVEGITAVEGPGRACAEFVVDENMIADEDNGCGVEVEGAVVVFPGRHFRG